MGFHQIEKERLQIEVPPEIAEIVRIKAARERTSISATAAALLCQALNRKPSEFGIGVKRTRKAPTAAAS